MRIAAAPYCASKGGVRLLTKAVALEGVAKQWGSGSIRSIRASSGRRWSRRARRAAQTGSDVETERKVLSDLHPLGRMGTAAEVAAAVLYLASDDSAFVTGSELTIDGGYTAG